MREIDRRAAIGGILSGVAATAGAIDALADESRETVDLAIAGDINLADSIGDAIARGKDPFAEFAEPLAAVDFAIGNLECVVSTKGEPVWKPWTFRAQPKTLATFKRHFDVVSLANNHSGDFGREAFGECLTLLERENVRYFGGGRDCAAARSPCLLEKHGVRIALLGYNEYEPRSFEAGPSWPGIAWSVEEQIVADIEAARSIHKADLVVPYMHWGDEECPENDDQRKLARAMIDAGADLVVGTHPHLVQGVETHKGKLIVYSIGNFAFGGFDEGSLRTGWLLRLRLDKKGLVAWDTIVLKMDADGTPRLVRDAASPCGTGDGKILKRKALVDSPLASSPVRKSDSR